MPLISVAMMVKNEAAHLERALLSIQPLSPELVILDTGSTDTTLDIAKRFTSKIYHQPWQNNFSLHRNKSFSYATGDWVIQLDADEELVWPNTDDAPRHFASFLRKIPEHIHAVIITLRDYRPSINRFSSEFKAVRIFRNGKVTYRRRVHNICEFKGEAVYYDGFYIKHYGYDLTDEQKKAKANRTIPLLLESLEEDPSDHDCLFYLCQAYEAWMNDHDNAMRYGKRYIEKRTEIGVEFKSSVYHTLARIHMNANQIPEAAALIKEGLSLWPKNVDLWYDTLLLAIKDKNPRSIATAAQNYIASYRQVEKDTVNFSGTFYFHLDSNSVANGLYYLVMSYLENGIIELNHLKKLLPMCSSDVSKSICDKIISDLELLEIEHPIKHYHASLQSAEPVQTVPNDPVVSG